MHLPFPRSHCCLSPGDDLRVHRDDIQVLMKIKHPPSFAVCLRCAPPPPPFPPASCPFPSFPSHTHTHTHLTRTRTMFYAHPQCMLVCKRWREVLGTNEILWEDTDLEAFHKKVTDDVLMGILERCAGAFFSCRFLSMIFSPFTFFVSLSFLSFPPLFCFCCVYFPSTCTLFAHGRVEKDERDWGFVCFLGVEN